MPAYAAGFDLLTSYVQPVNLNLDEETLMRVVAFWRSSLSTTNTQSSQYYFDHFEIHPIKVLLLTAVLNVFFFSLYSMLCLKYYLRFSSFQLDNC